MLTFNCFIPEVIEQMPIEKARIKNFEWYKAMVGEYVKSDPKPYVHTSRCPGILSVCNTGWIQRAYQDITITTNGDKETFEWKTEIAQALLPGGDLMSNYVCAHPVRQLFKFNEFKKDTLRSIVKIQSPWIVKIPPGYFLLSMPIPYNDCNHFTAATGILKDLSFLNVQMFWHTLNDTVVIKKGTPLTQYILVREEEVPNQTLEVSPSLISELHDYYIKKGDPAMAERCYPYILQNSSTLNQFVKPIHEP